MQHPKFQSEHLVRNVRRLRLLRNRLPLQTIKKHSVPIKDMKTPSTSTPFKDAYTISVTEHIMRILNNNNLYSQMKLMKNLNFGMVIYGKNLLSSDNFQLK